MLTEQGYLKVADVSGGKKKFQEEGDDSERNQKDLENPEFLKMLASLKKGIQGYIRECEITEGGASPHKR